MAAIKSIALVNQRAAARIRGFSLIEKGCAMAERVERAGLQVAAELATLLENDICPGTGIAPADFWQALADLVAELRPRNEELLALRETLQTFLEEIGYLLPGAGRRSRSARKTSTRGGQLAGPQLVVPVMNARYALNAANARWGIALRCAVRHRCHEAPAERASGYNPGAERRGHRLGPQGPGRGGPLAGGSHASEANGIAIGGHSSRWRWRPGGSTGLADPAQFAGLSGDTAAPQDPAGQRTACISRSTSTSSTRSARPARRVSDLHSGIGHVDDHGLRGFRRRRRCRGQGAGLSQLARPDEGRPEEEFDKGGRRSPADERRPRIYRAGRQAADLQGRSLMLVRNVGHLMTNDAMLDATATRFPRG
jgi:malate synthase